MIPLRDTLPSKNRPIVTYVLIALNVLVFLLFEFPLESESLRMFFYEWGMVPARLLDGNWAEAAGYTSQGLHTLFTNMFLHGGFAHLLFNMWALWIFGDNVEDKMGKWGFALFYLLAGLIASGTHLLFNMGSTVPAVGASGALAGVMAAYMFLYPKSRILTFVPVFFLPLLMEIRAFIFIGFWFVLQLLQGTVGLFSGTATGIAFWAHIGGFAGGYLLYRFFTKPDRPEPPQDEYGGEYVRFEEV